MVSSCLLFGRLIMLMHIDTNARREIAELLRHLVSGVITNDEFEDRLPRPLRASKDGVVLAVNEHAWCLYNDTFKHRLTGALKVSDEGRREIARWVLFLHTDLPYEWPFYRLTGPSTILRGLVGLFTLGHSTRQARAQFEAAGDFDVWPFFRRGDYERASSSQVLLRGAT
jgi:hypothetical protein